MQFTSDGIYHAVDVEDFDIETEGSAAISLYTDGHKWVCRKTVAMTAQSSARDASHGFIITAKI